MEHVKIERINTDVYVNQVSKDETARKVGCFYDFIRDDMMYTVL